MMKLLTVVGARPQFVKAAVLARAVKEMPELEEVLVHTGQHYDANMSDVIFQDMEISPPCFNLEIGSGSHGQQTGRMLEAIERILLDVRPDWVLVYGDTNSTLAGALAAAKLHVPVAHVEAGLRSYNRRMPEEINRALTDHVSDLLFAPTPQAVKNLKAEGLPESRIRLIGDVMYDAALFFASKADRISTVLDRLKLTPKGYILATVHRAENTEDTNRLRSIMGALSAVSAELPVVLPMHPRTRKVLEMCGWQGPANHLLITEPVGYLDMVMLEKNARVVATDSGGVQKEAFFFRIPCVTFRDETEWTELVELGCNRLVSPTGISEVLGTLRSMMNWTGSFDCAGLYGDGTAGKRIAETLLAAGRGVDRCAL